MININTPANVPSYVMSGVNSFFPTPQNNNSSSFNMTSFLQNFGTSGSFSLQDAASTAANAVAPGIGGALVSVLSSIIPGRDYKPGEHWKGWDKLDAKYNGPRGGQFFYHLANLKNKAAGSSLEETKADLFGYLKLIGVPEIFNLYAKALQTHPNNTTTVLPVHFYELYVALGNPADGKKLANAFSQFAYPNQPLPYSEIQPQALQAVNPLVSGNVGDGFMQNQNSNQPNEDKPKKNKWIAPALITVSVIGLMVLAFNYLKIENSTNGL